MCYLGRKTYLVVGRVIGAQSIMQSLDAENATAAISKGALAIVPQFPAHVRRDVQISVQEITA